MIVNGVLSKSNNFIVTGKRMVAANQAIEWFRIAFWSTKLRFGGGNQHLSEFSKSIDIFGSCGHAN